MIQIYYSHLYKGLPLFNSLREKSVCLLVASYIIPNIQAGIWVTFPLYISQLQEYYFRVRRVVFSLSSVVLCIAAHKRCHAIFIRFPPPRALSRLSYINTSYRRLQEPLPHALIHLQWTMSRTKLKTPSTLTFFNQFSYHKISPEGKIEKKLG